MPSEVARTIGKLRFDNDETCGLFFSRDEGRNPENVDQDASAKRMPSTRARRVGDEEIIK